jgi:GT2 family glycosyltransferase
MIYNNKPMNIFVIIVTYNGRKWYDKCLGSVTNSSIPVQTIVIDNASTDDTVSYIKENYPEIHLIESDKNLGFGKANNMGLEYALNNDCDYVYLLNQDAWVEPTTIEVLINVAQKNQEYGIISPMQITANQDKLDKNFSVCCNKCSRLIDDLYFNTLKDIYETEKTMAAHWLITRKCLMNVGGFSPVFTHYGEDDNLQGRANYHGFKNGICPLVNGIHDREFRPTTKKKTIHMRYVNLLIKSSDILRYTKGEKIGKLLMAIKDLFTLKSIHIIFILFKWLCNMPEILKYKKITKKKFPAFLNIT